MSPLHVRLVKLLVENPPSSISRAKYCAVFSTARFNAVHLLGVMYVLTVCLFWKVREEQAQLRPDPAVTITGDVLNQMTYSRQVVKEVLRYRPPASMVPQVIRLTNAPLTLKV